MPKAKLPIKTITLIGGGIRYEWVIDLNTTTKTAKGVKRDQMRRRFESWDKAEREYIKVKSEVDKNTHVRDRKVTFDQQCAEWLKGRKRLKDTSAVCYADVLKTPRERLGHLEMQRLTKPNFDGLRDWMHANGRRIGKKEGKAVGGPLAARSVNLSLMICVQVLEDAFKQDLVTRNVAALCDKLPEADEKEEPDTWTDAECVEFLNTTRENPLYAAFQMTLYGLRRGEVMGLRWSDIDLDEGFIRIRVTRIMKRGRPGHDVPKSKKGKRDLPIDAELIASLRRLKARQAAEKLRAGVAYHPVCNEGMHQGGKPIPLCQGDRHVFADEIGAPIHPEYYTTLFQRAAKEVGMRVIRLHEGRHTCGSVMNLRGIAPVIIAAWLGHADARFTMATYVHSNQIEVDKAGAVLALAYGRSGTDG